MIILFFLLVIFLFKTNIHAETFSSIINVSHKLFCLQLKELLDDAHGISRAVDSVANGSGVGVDFIVVAARVGLVTEEVDVLVLDAALLGIFLKVAKAVGLVPAGREDIEGDLTANREAIQNWLAATFFWSST